MAYVNHILVLRVIPSAVSARPNPSRTIYIDAHSFTHVFNLEIVIGLIDIFLQHSVVSERYLGVVSGKRANTCKRGRISQGFPHPKRDIIIVFVNEIDHPPLAPVTARSAALAVGTSTDIYLDSPFHRLAPRQIQRRNKLIGHSTGPRIADEHVECRDGDGRDDGGDGHHDQDFDDGEAG